MIQLIIRILDGINDGVDSDYSDFDREDYGC